MQTVEVSRPHLGGQDAFLTPFGQVVSLVVELDDPRIHVAIRNEYGIGQKGHEGWPPEMMLVVPGFAVGAQGLHQFLAVVAEFEDRVGEVVDDPDVLFRIVGIHMHGMRLHEHRIPLAPGLDNVALAVDDDQAMLPEGVDSPAIASPFPGRPAVLVVVIGARHRSVSPRHRSVAPGVLPPYGKAQERVLLVDQTVFRPVDLLQDAALKHKDSIRAFSENALRRAPGPVLVSG